jgi:DNA-binding MarR family transcriptional regulator
MLTARQTEVLKAWAQLGLCRLEQPTLRELASKLELKSRSATLQVRPLVRKGYLEPANKHRGFLRGAGLVLTRKGWEELERARAVPPESKQFFAALRKAVVKEVQERNSA